MNRFTCLIAAIAFSANAWALAPEIEVDRLLLQAKTALDTNDYAQAAESLAKAEKLGVQLPDTFYYHYGRAYGGAGKLEQGRAMLERYLSMSGTKGKFYQEALLELNKIEAAMKKKNAEKEAAIKQYNERLADYERSVANCPDRFDREVQSARKALREAERSCTSRHDGSNFCDSNEDRNSHYVRTPGTETYKRIQARKDLEKLQRTSSDEWCADRYTRPRRPDSM